MAMPHAPDFILFYYLIIYFNTNPLLPFQKFILETLPPKSLHHRWKADATWSQLVPQARRCQC